MDKKTYMVRGDIEGVSGVVSFEQAEPGKPEYAFGQRMFMADLDAVLAGLKDGGADEVVIYDQHYYGRNIDPAELPPYACMIGGKPPYRRDWPGGIDVTCSGVILLGFHSKMGTPGGLLNHSYEPDIRDLRINGVSVGEIGMEAAVAGDYGVPVLLVTGDSAGMAEAEALLPGVRTVTVKESLGADAGLCPALSVSTARVREAARSVATDPPSVAPYRTGDRVTLDVELNDGAYRVTVAREYPDRMQDARTLVIHGASATEVWADYWQLKLRCLGMP